MTSLSRLWELQILIISVPILIFTSVSLSVTDKEKEIERKINEYETSMLGILSVRRLFHLIYQIIELNNKILLII